MPDIKNLGLESESGTRYKIYMDIHYFCIHELFVIYDILSLIWSFIKYRSYINSGKWELR